MILKGWNWIFPLSINFSNHFSRPTHFHFHPTYIKLNVCQSLLKISLSAILEKWNNRKNYHKVAQWMLSTLCILSNQLIKISLTEYKYTEIYSTKTKYINTDFFPHLYFLAFSLSVEFDKWIYWQEISVIKIS